MVANFESIVGWLGLIPDKKQNICERRLVNQLTIHADAKIEQRLST
jgi:hypothetical protein